MLWVDTSFQQKIAVIIIIMMMDVINLSLLKEYDGIVAKLDVLTGFCRFYIFHEEEKLCLTANLL